MSSVNDTQVGGEHYKQFAIQPWDAITDWNLGFLDGSAVAYISRWKLKGGVQDLEKAIHFLQKLIEVEAAKAEARIVAAGAEGAFSRTIQEAFRHHSKQWLKATEDNNILMRHLDEPAVVRSRYLNGRLRPLKKITIRAPKTVSARRKVKSAKRRVKR